jgi:hypothetical protein
MEPINITPAKEPARQIAGKVESTPFDDEPLTSAATTPKPTSPAPNTWADRMDDEIKFAESAADFHAAWSAAIKTAEWGALKESDPERAAGMKTRATAKLAALKAAVSDEIEP